MLQYDMSFLFTTQLFYTLTFIAVMLVLANLLVQRKKPTSVAAWFILLVVFPYIGILLYIIFHDRKMKYTLSNIEDLQIKNQIDLKESFDSEVERFIYQDSGIYATYNDSFYLCKDANDSKERLFELLDCAKESIYISTYIFGKDEITREMVNLLAKKAKEGVEVKLLIDAFGSALLELNPSFLSPIKDAGGEYLFFMSIFKKPLTSKINLRNHRKMIIVDHINLISGGINISKEYLGDESDNGVYKDISFVLKGAIGVEYEEVFAHDWKLESGKLPNTLAKKEFSSTKSSIIQLLPSGPDVDSDTLYEALIYAIHQAKKSIWIVSPYFAPENTLQDALIIALHRGVEVKIISPLSSDHYFVDIARDAFLRELEQEGAKIIFYKKKLLHAKAILIDDETAIVGSANFDARSLFYNFEIVSVLYSKADILQVRSWIKELFSDSIEGLKETNRVVLMIEKFFKIFAPAL